jgi:hypothetical protein
MSISDVLKPKSKEVIIQEFEKLGLDPDLITKIRSNDEAYNKMWAMWNLLSNRQVVKIRIINKLVEIYKTI